QGELLRRGRAAAEGKEDLESGAAGPVVKLDADRADAVEVARLLDGEGGAELPPANVHVERLRLDVEELAPDAEAAELADRLAGRAAVGDNDMDLAELLQGREHLLPASDVQFDGPAIG